MPVKVTNSFRYPVEIVGYLEDKEIIRINKRVTGKWFVETPISLTTNVEEAERMTEVFTEAFNVYHDLLKDQPKPQDESKAGE